MIQAVPPSSAPVCPGGRLVFTCTTSNPGLEAFGWRQDSGSPRFISANGNPITVGSFNITATVINGSLVSTAINESVPVQLNGTSIGCSENLVSYARLIIINR